MSIEKAYQARYFPQNKKEFSEYKQWRHFRLISQMFFLITCTYPALTETYANIFTLLVTIIQGFYFLPAGFVAVFLSGIISIVFSIESEDIYQNIFLIVLFPCVIANMLFYYKKALKDWTPNCDIRSGSREKYFTKTINGHTITDRDGKPIVYHGDPENHRHYK